jgi:hypothetical protein
MSDDEAPPVKTRKVNDKQMAGLRKGMEALKAKREALAKEREVHEEKQTKGEIPADAPKPKFIPNPKPPKVVKVSAPPPEPEVIHVERKKREVKAKIAVDDVKSELAALRSELAAMKKPAEVKEVPVEKVVEKVVHKEKVVTGSEMLNLLFNLK